MPFHNYKVFKVTPFRKNIGRQWLAFSEIDEYYIECKMYIEQQREKGDVSH